MKNKSAGFGLFPAFLLNLILNLTWLLPAAILLVLHFWIKLPYWWAVGAAGLWFFGVLCWTFFISFSVRAGSEQIAPKANKNPYSAKAVVGKVIDPFCPRTVQMFSKVPSDGTSDGETKNNAYDK